MPRQTINIGSAPNDGTGDPLRNAYDKCNDNFLELYEEGGDNITVTDPTTSADATLNDALQNVLDAGGGGGGAVDSVNGQTGVVSVNLNSVLTEGAKATDKTIELNSASSDDVILLDAPSQTMGVVNPATGDSSAVKSSFIQSVNLTTGENVSLYKDKIRRAKGGFSSDLVFTDPTANRTITFKDESGTVALLTDVPTLSYRPYRFVDATQTTYLGAVIGLSETPVAQTTILGSTFNSSDLMKILFRVTKGATSAGVNMRIRVNTTNNLGTATQIGILTLGAVSTYGLINRNINLFGGNAYNYNSASTLASDILLTNTAGTSFTYNTANDLYVFFTIQLGNVLDSATFQFANITN